jgi:hypothetical protein
MVPKETLIFSRECDEEAQQRSSQTNEPAEHFNFSTVAVGERPGRLFRKSHQVKQKATLRTRFHDGIVAIGSPGRQYTRVE